MGHPRRHPEIRRVSKSQEQATRGLRPPGGDVKGVSWVLAAVTREVSGGAAGLGVSSEWGGSGAVGDR